MKNSPIALILTAAAIIFVAIWIFSFPVLVHKEAIKNELRSSFESVTGMQFEIQGETTLKMLPSPHLNIQSLYVINSQDAKAPFFLTIKNLDIWPVFTSLFKSKIVIKKLQASGVDIEVEALRNGKMNWQDLSSYWQNGQSGKHNVKSADPDLIHDIQISDGHINYVDSLSNRNMELENINASYSMDEADQKAGVHISLDYRNTPFTISGEVGGGIGLLFSPAAASVKLTIASSQNTVMYDGKAQYANSKAILNGNAQLATDDLAYWVRLYRGDKTDNAAAHYKKLPLTAKAKIAMKDSSQAALSDIVLDGEIIKGTADADITFPDQLDLNAAISKLNLEAIMENGFLADFQSPLSGNAYSATVSGRTPAAFDISADIAIEDMVYNNKHISNTRFTADMTNGELTVPQFLTSLPGGALLSFSGIGNTRGEGLTVEGQVDVEGSNFIETLGLFKSAGLALPAEDFKRFHLRTNAVISYSEVRLSELVARIENITASGGLIARLGDRTSLQTALLVKGLNLDHIAALWGVQDWHNLLLNYNKIGNNSDGVISVWLKRLGYDIAIGTALEDYTLNGKLYHNGSFNLSATAGKMELDGEKISYNDSVISGKVGIDVSKEIPIISLQANIDRFDADHYFADSKPPSGERWSTDLFDLKWLDLVNGTYSLRFGQFKYKFIDAEDFNVSGTVVDQKLNIDNLKATIGGANVLAKVSLSGGAIPTLTAAADIDSINVEHFASWLPLLHGISGACNANLRLTTNGVNQASLISNLKGSVGIRGRDISVHGFNLSGIIRAVHYVRTVADILNVVKRSYSNGDTAFSQVEGGWDISQGVMETENMKISNDQADGVMASRFDLAKWTTDVGVHFALKSLDAVNPPVIIVKMAGDIDNPSLDFDTSPLEQYVNSKTSEKMLQNYGAR